MLETKRLRLDLPVPEHSPLMAYAYQNSQADLQKWMIWAQAELTQDDAEEFIAGEMEKEDDITFFPIIKETGQFVGSFSLILRIAEIPSYEIGYWVDSTLVGNGYATEVVNTLAAYAFAELGARRLEIKANINNIASQRVAEKCGFTCEGIARNGAAHWGETGAIDVKLFSLIPSDILG